MKKILVLVALVCSAVLSKAQCPIAYPFYMTGAYCGGAYPHMILSNSESGVDYQLYTTGGASVGSPISGSTGVPIDFGPIAIWPGAYTTGLYSVLGVHTTSHCPTTMRDSALYITGTPSIINYTSPVCPGSIAYAYDSILGGTWSSSNTSIATVDTITGRSGYASVGGVSAGTAIITYSITSSCGTLYRTASITVAGSAGTAPTVTGLTNICIGVPVTYTISSSGGYWSTSSSMIATVNSSTGVLMGIAAGAVTLSYTVYTSCGYVVGTLPVTVAASSAISLPFALMSGDTVTATTTVASPTWGISPVSIASISTSGLVTGLTAGMANVFFTTSSTCHSHFLPIVPAGSIIADSFYVSLTRNCSGPLFRVVTNIPTASLNLRTYYGDGTSDYRSVGGSYMFYADTFSHVYTTSGTYAVKHVLYLGSSAVDSVSYSYNYLQCHDIGLSMYYDANSNCINDAGDMANIVPLQIAIDSNGVRIDTIPATSSAYYHAYGSTGDIYAFQLLPTTVLISCPSSGVLYDTLSSGYGHDTLMAGLACSATTGYDMLVTATSPARTNAQDFFISARNHYCTSDSAVVTVHFSPRYYFSSAYPTPNYISGNTVKWYISHLSDISGSHPDFHLRVNAPSGAFLTVGDTVHSDISITPIGSGDVDTSNNYVIEIDTVRASYDPNHVAVSPSGNILNGTQLRYTVEFENDGNDTAHNIYVMDTLSDNLDVSTLHIVSATATMTTTVLYSGGHSILKFDFHGINLLDSSHHGLCTGMFVYDIKARTGLADGTLIYGHAGIYFDINPVVLTDSSRNRILIPHVSIAATEDTICHGGIMHFSATPYSVGNPHYRWFINTTAAGTDSVDFTTHSVAGGDVVKCVMRTIMDDTVVSVSNTITVIERVLSAGTISGASLLCLGDSASLSSSVSGGTWSGTGAHISVSASGRMFSSSVGADTVVYSVTNACGTATSTHAVSVLPFPSAGIIAGASSVCAGSTVTLTDSTTGGTWSATNTHATVSGGGVVNGVTAGLDTIVYSISNYCGTATATHIVTVNSLTTVADSIWVTRDSVCAGDTVTFTVIPTNGGSSPSFQWMRFSTMVDTGTTFTYIPTLGDVITCRMTSSVVCPVPAVATSNSITMMVVPVVTPTVSIIATPNDTVAYIGQLITFYATATYGGTPTMYQWYEHGAAVSGATSSSYATHVSSNDTVYCIVTSNAPCATSTTASSNTIVIYADYLGIHDIQSLAGTFALFPNPNSGVLTISGKVNGNDALAFEVRDVTAKLITTGTLQPNNGTIEQSIHLDNALPSGNYFIRIMANEGTVVLPFVKE